VSRRLPLVLAIVLVLLAAAGGTMAWADHKASGKLSDGISVAGVDVGGLSEDAAVAKLEAELGAAAVRPVKVKVAGERFRLSAERAGVQLALRDAVRRAYRQSRDGSLPERAWRQLTGGGSRTTSRPPPRSIPPPSTGSSRGSTAPSRARRGMRASSSPSARSPRRRRRRAAS
jgi:hypothetical protein